jgi:type II secretory pathway pseudopilin PulG
MRSKGFTIVEIVVAVGLGALIFATVGILAVRWFENRQLRATTSTLSSYLRTAAVRAIQCEGGVDHGVSRADGNLTLFRGATYASRQASYDTVFTYPSNIQFSGITEVVFSCPTGLPNLSGTVSIGNGLRSNDITVYSSGAISGP